MRFLNHMVFVSNVAHMGHANAVFRVFYTGKDSRFSEVVEQPLKYLIYWVLQAIWVSNHAACA